MLTYQKNYRAEEIKVYTSSSQPGVSLRRSK